MEIIEILQDKRAFLPLLLLGDEQEDMIDRYLDHSRLLALYDSGLKAVCAVTDAGEGVAELKNLAVTPEAQRRGYGRAMVSHAALLCRETFHTLLVGTGETPSSLSFYRACGFRESHRVPGFFTQNYDHLMFEEGIQLVDMVYLRLELS